MGLWQSFIGFFRRRPKIKAIITDEAGMNHYKKVYYENSAFFVKINGKKHAYVVDNNFITYDSKNKQATSFYDINNPQPVRRLHQRDPEVDSVSFKAILDSKAITDLFSAAQKNMMMFLIILVIANIVVSIIIICIQTCAIKTAMCPA